MLDWYHDILIYPGKKQMIETIKLVFTWSGLNKQVKELVRTYHECHLCKQAGKKKYGLLPPKIAESIRWNRVNIDLWGPKSVVKVNGFTYELHLMTMSNTEESSYALDLKSMREAQLTDKVLMKLVKQHITSKGHNDTVYTYKSVEGIELIHKNNKILVPQSKQQRVLD